MKIKFCLAALTAPFTASTMFASVVLIDFGATGQETSGNWNNVVNSTGKSSHNTMIADLIDDAGASTGFSLNTVAASVVGANINGATTTNTGFPSSATGDSFYIEGAESVTLTFSNLDAGQNYDFTFYASRNGSGTARIANYEVIGGNKTDNAQLNAYGNVDNTVSLSGFTADASNEIVINFTRESGSYAYLGVLEMESSAIPEPSHYALALGAIGGLLILHRRRNK